MKKILSILMLFLVTALLSGCIISHTPTEDPVNLTPGVAKIFTIKVFLTPLKYVWSVDGTVDTGATENTYSYMLNDVLPSKHTITVKAVHLFFTDVYTWNVQYEGTNKSPTANAGPDQYAYADDIVTLDGSGSTDPDNNIVTYLWEQIGEPTVTLLDPNAMKPQFEANVPAGSSLSFKLTVTDAGGLSSSDICVVAINDKTDKTWHMFRHDRQHTGRSPYKGAQTANLKWTFTTGTIVYDSPAIGADGTVYVGEWAASGSSFASNVYAIDGTFGTQKWAFTTGDWIWGSPAIGTDGTVYVGSDDFNVYAIDGTFGTQKWVFTTGAYVDSSPAIGADGTVYVGSYDKKVYALDSIYGHKIWEFTAGSCVSSSPAIGLDGTVYVGDLIGKVYALYGTTGIEKWEYAMEFPTGDQVQSSPAIGADGTVYVGGYSHGKVYALDSTDGHKIWEFATGSAVWSSPAIGADGTVYVGSYYNGKVFALDGTTGAKKWEYQTGGYVDSSPAIGADGTVYIGSSDGKVYAFRDPD